MFDIARGEGNLIPVKTQPGAHDRVSPRKGRTHVNGITPATQQTSNGSTPQVPTASFRSAPHRTECAFHWHSAYESEIWG